MKTLISLTILIIVVNVLAYLFVEAWDKEETERAQRTRQYIQMLREENAANERR